MGCSKSSSKREVYSNTILPQEIRKTSNRQPNFAPKTTGKKKEQNISKIRRKEIIRIRAERNEKEMKETILKINKTKSCFFEKINKMEKPLAKLIKKKKGEESNQENQIRKSRGYNRQRRNTKNHKSTMSNYMPIKLTTWKKWTDS